MAAPFQQGSTAYQTYQAKLSPTAFLGPNGAAFEAALGAIKDAMLGRLVSAVKAHMPSVAPADALAFIGAERGMPRGGSETDAAYAARLLNAWNTWPWAGTAYGLLQAFYATGYTNVVLAQPNGGAVYTLDQGGTNLLAWSGDLSKTSVWSTTNCTVAINNAAAPDGTTTAALLTATANAGFIAQQGIASAAAVQYAASCYLKLSGGAHSAELVIWDVTAGSALATTGLVALPASSFTRFSVSGLGVAGHALQLRVYPAGNQAATGACLAAYPQLEAGSAASPYVQTYVNNSPVSAGAGVLLKSNEPGGLWLTDTIERFPVWGGFTWSGQAYGSPLSYNGQQFWSKFDVLFPLPLNPSGFSWASGVPAFDSAEANFIRALIASWKPGHATCNRIIISTQGNLYGYPAGKTLAWGSFNWGRGANWNYPLANNWGGFNWGGAYFASPTQLGLTFGASGLTWGSSSTTTWSP